MTRGLPTLLRLRRLQEQQARRSLAETAQQAAHAARELAEARAAPAHEAGGDARAFATWLPAALQHIEASARRAHACEAALAAARDALAGARARVRVVETVQEKEACSFLKKRTKKLLLLDAGSGHSTQE